MIHLDYQRLGDVHMRLTDDTPVESNPDGFADGEALANLLVTEPRPRNRALADAMKRIGVVERSGRGVDTIYRGMLKFGRSAPDYSRTDAQNVVLRLPTEPADLEFRRLVVDEERRRNAALPIDSLIALGALRELKRLTAEELAERIQRDAASAKRTLEALTEAGFVEAHGATRGRTYMLSAAVYGAVADKAAYTRQAGFAPIQHEQMVLSYVRQHGRIKRAEAMELCRLSEGQVKNLLKRMSSTGALVLHGAGAAAHYRIGSSDRVVSDEIG
ncbi:MAG: ATP-binding protein [Giesbergeria sp.]